MLENGHTNECIHEDDSSFSWYIGGALVAASWLGVEWILLPGDFYRQKMVYVPGSNTPMAFYDIKIDRYL
jgi:hypothetical protein